MTPLEYALRQYIEAHKALTLQGTTDEGNDDEQEDDNADSSFE